MTKENLTKGERTRSDIFSAAYQLFLEQGYHGTSMRQISHNAGVALSSIYNHFKSKEELFVAILDAYHPYHEILPALQTARGETIEAYVHNAAGIMVAALDKHPGFVNLMFTEIVEFDSQHVPHMFQTYFPRVIDAVQRFAERQNNLRSIPLSMLIRVFIGLFFSFYITEYILSEQLPSFELEDALKHYVDVFLYGIVSQGVVR